jgi:hypothetical protein
VGLGGINIAVIISSLASPRYLKRPAHALLSDYLRYATTRYQANDGGLIGGQIRETRWGETAAFFALRLPPRLAGKAPS